MDSSERYRQIVVDAMAYLDMTNMKEIEEMTVVEYGMRMDAKRIRDFERVYEAHRSAFLNVVAAATEKQGKKTVPKYPTLDSFFDVKEQRKKILGDVQGAQIPAQLSARERLMLRANQL